jgi:hypothetical protein
LQALPLDRNLRCLGGLEADKLHRDRTRPYIGKQAGIGKPESRQPYRHNERDEAQL